MGRGKARATIERSQEGPHGSSASTTSVAVTGMHRTGTSVVARMLREGGSWFGNDHSFIKPAPDNPEGFFEHERLVRLSDELLEATGGAWDHPPASGPLSGDDPRVAHLSERARATIAELSAHERWGWKDPRICLTAPFWLDLVPELRFIVCLRHPVEVAMSLKRRNQISYALGLSLWERYYSALLDVVPTGVRLVTHFGALFDASAREVDRILNFAALPTTSRADVLEAINPELRHQRAQIALSEAGVSLKTVELYARLCEEAGWGTEVDISTEPQVSVHAAVLDLAAAKDLTERQERAISTLEGRLGGARKERGALIDRVKELEGERAGLADEVRDLEEQRDRLSDQVGSLEKTNLLLGERLAGVEGDATAAILTSLNERMEHLEHSVYRLIEESIVERSADSAVAAGRRIIYEHVPTGCRVLVAGKGDPGYADIGGRLVTNFPQDASGRYPGFALANSQALLAHLEALRCAGNRFLLIPSSSNWLLEYYSSFGEYLLEHYRVEANDPSFGMLVDITDRQLPTSQWPSGVSGVIDRIAAGAGRNLAVLDMTQFDVAARVPWHNVFVPSNGGGALPYLDSTIDVVVVESDDDLAEAKRTATEAVVRVRSGPNGAPEVGGVQLLSTRKEEEDRLAVIVGSESSSTPWADHVAQVLEELPSAFLATGPDAFDRADTIALVDEGVLPLPSCLSEASRLLSSAPEVGAVAVKLLRADGALEAAGVMLFADGSAAGIGEGSFDVGASWHEYVRETCWGPGLMVFRAEAVRDLLRQPPGLRAQAALADHVWSGGSRVLYQPAAVAVRATPDAGLGGQGALAWSLQLGGRPERPTLLDDASWQTLLAAEDVAGGRQ